MVQPTLDLYGMIAKPVRISEFVIGKKSFKS